MIPTISGMEGVGIRDASAIFVFVCEHNMHCIVVHVAFRQLRSSIGLAKSPTPDHPRLQ